MAGKIIADTIQTENSFLQLNVGQTLVATINSSGILNSSGGIMVGANGSVSNTAISGVITGSQLASPLALTGNLNFDSTGTTGVRSPAANTLAFYTAGTEDVRIDATGNVGIGTASPTAVTGFSTGRKVLQITPLGGGNTQLRLGATSGSMLDHDDSGSTITTLRSLYGTTDANAQMQFQSGFITFGTGTSFTERMRIKSDGILVTGGATSEGGIDVGNSTNPGVAIYGTSSAKGIITVQNNNDSCMYMSKASGYTSGIYAKLYVNSSQVGKIETNGSTTSYVTTSDYRLKEDIAPLSGALNTVALLKPVTYKWKTTGDAGQGFIAHELQEVVPEAVSGAKDATETYTDEDGNEQTRIAPQGIDTSFLVATLTAAIQEQQAIISDLKARIEALEA